MIPFKTIEITNRQPATYVVPWGSYVGTQTVVPGDPEINEEVYDDQNSIVLYKDPPLEEVSWKLVREQRLIKMTPFRVGRIDTSQEYLARLPFRDWVSRRYADDRFVEGQEESYDSLGLTGSIDYDQVVSLSTIRSVYQFKDAPHYSLNKVKLDEQLDKVINEVKAKVIQDSFSNFDLLTEIGEGKETLEMLASFLKLAINPVRGIRELIEKQKKIDKMNRKTPAARRRAKQANDELSSQWMQYRYGIMPLVYSIQDILELMDKASTEFKTSRSFQIINPNDFVELPSFGIPDNYLIDIYKGHIRVNAVGKAKFDGIGLRLLDQITINPFLTAWELIPMSFVVDWFVNVGDVLFSKTSTLADLAVQRQFCVSIKEDYTRFVSAHADYRLDHTFESVGYSDIPDVVNNFEFVHKSEQPLRTFKHSEYKRFLVTPDSVKLQFFPSMNWMRWTDAYALSLKPILKALKKL